MAAPMKLQDELFKLTQNGVLFPLERFIEGSFGEDKSWLDLYHKRSGDTVLTHAARGGNCEILHLLRKHGQDLEQANFDGKRALHEAAQFGNLSCVNYLIKQGVQIDALKRADWTPLMLACTKINLPVIKALLEAGANPKLINKDGWNSFHLACREGDIDIAQLLLTADDSLWQAVSHNGRSPLHTAALHGRTSIVSLLLSARCRYDIECRDSCGSTPLMDALRAGQVEVAALLVRRGASLHAEDSLGRQAVHLAAQAGATESLRYLVHAGTVDVNVASSVSGGTPLHLAAKEGQAEALEFLLESRADVTKVDNKGRLALHIGSGSQHPHCVSLLLHHGAVDQKDNAGNTARDLAQRKEVIHCFENLN